MKLTPHIIKNQEFSRAVRGFDRDEVNSFLENVSDELEHLQFENEKIKSENELLNEQVRNFKKIEKNLQETLLKAQDSSTKAVDSAKKQTALMIKEAELKAIQIVDSANENANYIRNSVMKLREEKNLLVAKIRAMVDSQAKLLALNVENIESEPIITKANKNGNNINLNNDINVNDILEKLL